jgi:hypothetical protein
MHLNLNSQKVKIENWFQFQLRNKENRLKKEI